MLFNKTHRTLAGVSNDYVIHGLLQADLRALGEQVLAETGRGNKRACPLKPLIVIWLVVAMALYRNLSIPNVFWRLLHWVRAVEPWLGTWAQMTWC